MLRRLTVCALLSFLPGAVLADAPADTARAFLDHARKKEFDYARYYLDFTVWERLGADELATSFEDITKAGFKEVEIVDTTELEGCGVVRARITVGDRKDWARVVLLRRSDRWAVVDFTVVDDAEVKDGGPKELRDEEKIVCYVVTPQLDSDEVVRLAHGMLVRLIESAEDGSYEAFRILAVQKDRWPHFDKKFFAERKALLDRHGISAETFKPARVVVRRLPDFTAGGLLNVYGTYQLNGKELSYAAVMERQENDLQLYDMTIEVRDLPKEKDGPEEKDGEKKPEPKED